MAFLTQVAITDRVVTIAADAIDAANASQFETQVCAAITEADGGPVIVDMTTVTFIDSRCINAMAGAEKFAAANGSTLSWRGLRPQAAHVLAITRLEVTLDLG
jgi:anti-anti-sigma factor